MANTFKNSIASAVGTSEVDVYTVPSATTTTVIGFTVANIHTSNIVVDIKVTDASTSGTAYLIKGATVPVGGGLVPIGGDQKLVLEQSDVISVTSNTASSADVIVSVLEQG
tara:strand:- start:423 stop:755 length:333 start_codon:yes stop_codon:yes gene_type:complete